MSRFDLKAFLDAEGALLPDEVLCPVLSRYDLGERRDGFEVKPALAPLTVPCIGRRCGQYGMCFNVQQTPPPEKVQHAGQEGS